MSDDKVILVDDMELETNESGRTGSATWSTQPPTTALSSSGAPPMPSSSVSSDNVFHPQHFPDTIRPPVRRPPPIPVENLSSFAASSDHRSGEAGVRVIHALTTSDNASHVITEAAGNDLEVDYGTKSAAAAHRASVASVIMMYSPDIPGVANGARAMEDVENYYAHLEREENMKCVVSGGLFVVVVASFCLVALLLNPEM